MKSGKLFAVFLVLALMLSLVPFTPVYALTSVFINEIHYDNDSTDAGEAIEIAGPAGTNLTGWSVVLYNGSSTQLNVYDTINLSGMLPDQDNGYGTLEFPRAGIQNGAPDGLALVTDGGTVLQFLSYEGTFTAADGPASGMTSVDIGVSEGSSTPVGYSLQLTGSGTMYEDFTWAAAATHTFGTPNTGQTFISGGGVNLSIDDVSANEGNSGTTSFDFTVTLSAPAEAGGVTFDIATADNTATVADNDYVANSLTGQPIAEGSTSYTFSVLVNGDTTAETDETFFVNVTNVAGATVVDGQGQGTIVNDDVVLTLIHEIQGSGGTVTGAGPFTVEAIVVGDFQTQGSGELRGFFIQEEDADADADPATSEGIFVFCSGCPTEVNVGDKVQVTGGASEFFGMSQLSATSAGSVVVVSSANPLPTPTSIDLPASGSTRAAATFENVEGMLVTFTDTLYVSEYFELARYGQLVLTADARPSQFTDANEPSESGYAAFLADLNSKRIILDDDNNLQNDAVTGTPDEPYFWPRPGLSITNFVRGGDSITGLTGVLHWSFAGQGGTDAWRVRPVEEAFSYDFASNNERTAEPEDVGGSLKVASFNVLNYFTTINSRGADSTAELDRQRAKTAAAICTMDADIVGLIEIENNGAVAITDLLNGSNGINANCGPYDFVDTGVIGTDAIAVAFIYRPATVSTVGDFAILDSSVDPRFNDDKNRPALAQTFEESATGGVVTVVVNHLKSKGSSCNDVGDPDLQDGQANCNITRMEAAAAMVDWLATDPTGSGDDDFLIIGDLNSYRNEDPIDAIEAGADDLAGTEDDYTDLLDSLIGASAYSYLFDGQLGYLDHALASSNLFTQVTGVTVWHINADEIPVFDYNDDIRDVGNESSFERESTSLPIYEPDAYRSSDHDPVIVGLDLLHYEFSGFSRPIDSFPAVNKANAGSSVPVKFSLAGDRGLDIFVDGYPKSQEMSCDFSSAIGMEESTIAGGNGLKYDASIDQYNYAWKTDETWAGTCRQLIVKFIDGSTYYANFSFK